MVNNKDNTKNALLHQLESIKGLLNEDDHIPILQEVIKSDEQTIPSPVTLFEQPSLLDTLKPQDTPAIFRKPLARATQVTATGENPFLPQHIRARLKGSNPPPLFSAADKIAMQPYRVKPDKALLVSEVVAQVMPQVEKILRERLNQLKPDELAELITRDT